jgi:hypothetical protein
MCAIQSSGRPPNLMLVRVAFLFFVAAMTLRSFAGSPALFVLCAGAMALVALAMLLDRQLGCAWPSLCAGALCLGLLGRVHTSEALR